MYSDTTIPLLLNILKTNFARVGDDISLPTNSNTGNWFFYSSTNPIDELTERPNDKFGRFLYDLAYILAILGGIILVIVILINFVSILSRIIFFNPLVGDFELVEIGSAIAISSFLP